MKHEDLAIGIDGGATHTTAVILDAAGTELVRLEGVPGIVNPADPEACVGRLAVLARRAMTAADILPPVHSLCCALAGAGRAELREVVRAELAREHIARNLLVTTDAEAALADAFGEAPGILLIAGTGSIAWGRAEDGRVVRCGGWGAVLGDEGSGYALGLGALRATARAVDGREAGTDLHDAVQAELGLDKPEQLIGWAARAAKDQVAALAPLVMEHAKAGDPVAVALRDEAASALADHVAVLHRRLGPWREPAVIAFAGGLIRPGGSLRAALRAALQQRGLECSIREDVIDAARGAARLARRAAGS